MKNCVVTNPYDLSVACEVPFHSREASRQALRRARQSQPGWAAVPVERRVGLVREAIQYFETHRDEVAGDISRQMGKPIQQSLGEINGLFERTHHMCEIAADALADDVLPDKAGFDRRIVHEPLGVVLDIAAWNYPLLIAVNVVVPALLAGNTVLIKHSSQTPLCGQHFERALRKLGEHDDLLQHLVLSHADTESLIDQPDISYVSFTGSVGGGLSIYRSVARRFIDAGLELGGKDPAYVAADADLDQAVEGIVDGACYNAGQSCCAVERVYVHESLYDAFVDKAKAIMASYVAGDPLDDKTTLGPLSSESGLLLVNEQVVDAQSQGATIVCGGTRLDVGNGLFFAPTILTKVNHDMRVMKEESFGPLLPVMPVANDDEALNLMNDSPFGLTASVWTRDTQRAEHLASRLQAGTIYMNRCDYLDPALPWTGVKDSGKGTSLSKYGFHALTRRKSLHFRLG